MANKRRTTVMAVIAVSGLAALAVCVLWLHEGPYERQTKDLESADVASEVRDAVAKGDCRFVGVMGFGMAVPGVPDYHERYADRYGVRIIPNTTDAIENDAHHRLQRAAWSYAERYNAALLQKLPPDAGLKDRQPFAVP